jgi:hypothetical protein
MAAHCNTLEHEPAPAYKTGTHVSTGSFHLAPSTDPRKNTAGSHAKPLLAAAQQLPARPGARSPHFGAGTGLELWLGWQYLTKKLQAPWHKGVCFNSLPSFGDVFYTKSARRPRQVPGQFPNRL